MGLVSNMSPHAIVWDGKVWPTAEALFQALRLAPENPRRQQIRLQPAPVRAKQLARKFRSEMIVTPRSEQDLDNMRRVLRLKVEQNREALRPEIEALLASDDSWIVEDVTRRPGGSGLYWGAALVDEENGVWRGENWLGWLWMELRADLLKNRPADRYD